MFSGLAQTRRSSGDASPVPSRRARHFRRGLASRLIMPSADLPVGVGGRQSAVQSAAQICLLPRPFGVKSAFCRTDATNLLNISAGIGYSSC
jgi:hypothetical protein